MLAINFALFDMTALRVFESSVLQANNSLALQDTFLYPLVNVAVLTSGKK